MSSGVSDRLLCGGTRLQRSGLVHGAQLMTAALPNSMAEKYTGLPVRFVSTTPEGVERPCSRSLRKPVRSEHATESADATRNPLTSFILPEPREVPCAS